MISTILTALLFCAGPMTDCTNGGNQLHVVQGRGFTLPTVPAQLQDPAQRAAYVITHYWDHFDFADTSLIDKPEITEQAFADYLNIFPHTSIEVVEKSIIAMLDRAIASAPAMFTHFAELYEKYLYDLDSPFRDEDYYITVLRAITANKEVDEVSKIRPRYQLEMALKNRPGDISADFEFTLKNGRVMKLSEVSTAYTILFFNNPDCHDCIRVKKMLSELLDLNVKIVCIYPDEDIELWQGAEYPASWVNGRTIKVRDESLYDLGTIPTLYLLDKEKRVVLKDAPIEKVIDWLDKLN